MTDRWEGIFALLAAIDFAFLFGAASSLAAPAFIGPHADLYREGAMVLGLCLGAWIGFKLRAPWFRAMILIAAVPALGCGLVFVAFR